MRLAIFAMLTLGLSASLTVAAASDPPSGAVPTPVVGASVSDLELTTAALASSASKVSGQASRLDSLIRQRELMQKELQTLRGASIEREQQKVAALEKQITQVSALIDAYRAGLAKEARETRRIQAQARKLALAMKAQKVKTEAKQLAAQRAEAVRRAEAAMQQAESALAIGIVSASLQVAAAAANGSDGGV